MYLYMYVHRITYVYASTCTYVCVYINIREPDNHAYSLITYKILHIKYELFDTLHKISFKG